MTRIGIIATPADIHAVKWATALAAAGCKVFFFCPAPDLVPVSQVEMIPIEGRNQETWNYFDFIWSVRRLRIRIQEHPCQIYISLHVTPFGVWAHWAGVRRHMIMALGADILEYTLQLPEQFRWSAESDASALYKRISRVWHRLQVKKALQNANVVWADNQTLRSAITDWLPNVTCGVFTWGIDTGFYMPAPSIEAKAELKRKLGIPENAVVVISGRGLKSVYHPQTVLSAARLLKDENIYWVILKGNYAVPEAFFQESNLHTTTQVRFVFELLSSRQLRAYYQASDIMVSLPEYDGMSAPVLEALASGLFPILSDVPGNLEIQREGLVLSLCDPNQAEDLCEKVIQWKSQYDQSSKTYVSENRKWVCSRADLSSQTRHFLQWLERTTLH